MSKFEIEGCIGDGITGQYHMPTCKKCHSGIHAHAFLSEADAVAEGFIPAICCIEAFMERTGNVIYAGDRLTQKYHKYTCPNCHPGLYRHEFLSTDEETMANFEPSECCFGE